MARGSSHRPNRQPCSLEQIAQLLDRTERERTGLFWAEGCRSLFAAIQRDWPIQSVVYCPTLLRSRSAWIAFKNLPPETIKHRVSAEQFQHLTRRNEPDGIGVVCAQRWTPLIGEDAEPGRIWVALDSIRTPGNLGTILRTCAATGVRGVMLIGGEVDPFDPAAIRASMGAVFMVPLIRTSSKALAGWKSRRSIHFVGTSPGAIMDYRKTRYPKPLVLMMGSERSGLRGRLVALCDEMVSLPMISSVDSLNLAVATSVMLYEATRDCVSSQIKWPGI